MLSDDIVITGNRAIARSYAKINLTLDITGKRDDGYHNVEMIMQTVSLFDLIILDKTRGEIGVSTNLKYLPNNDKNIAYKAVRLFREETRIRGGAKIIIHKNIPVAAGLAGGSGNAAAVLCAMNMLYNTGLSEKKLCEMGAALGADVPYCIMGGTYLASGIGDILTPLPDAPKAYALLVKPSVNVSTQAVYSAIDAAQIPRRPNTRSMTAAIKNRDIATVADNLCNVMEAVTENDYPEIRAIKEKMLSDGALGAQMSGSGPTVFGLFDDYIKAKNSADGFLGKYKDVYVTRFYG